MRSSIWLVGVLALGACSDDEGPFQPEIDGGHPDGSIDASSDASKDGGSDASLDCSPLDAPYKFSSDGGNAPWHDVYTVSSSGTVKVERSGSARFDAGSYACSGSLGACGTAALDVADFTGALRNAASLWGDGSAVIGLDPRPYDGQVLVVERTSDGKKIVVGSQTSGQCDASTGCGAFPPAAAQLQTLFDRLRTEVALGDQGDGGLAGACTR